MPPFSRLVRSLLLLIVACVLENGVIKLVHSNLSDGYNIQIGELTSQEAERNAVTKLSNGPNQQIWWKLAEIEWHESAIRRFFDIGPLLAAEMVQLGKSKSRVDSNVIDSAGAQTDNLMVALQRLSTANYTLNKWMTGTGTIEASMWTLLFLCIDINSCYEGYFVPIVTIPKDENVDQQQPHTTTYQYTYAALFLNLGDNLIVNAIPSFIGKLPIMSHIIPVDGDAELSIAVNVHNNVPTCTNSTAVGFRSLLDAAYGLVPGSACIKFSTDEQFNLLVFLGLPFVNGTQSIKDLPTLETFISESLQVNKTDEWEQRPFEECSTAMIMSGFQDVMEIELCDQNSKICILARGPTCSGVEFVRFLQSVASLSASCTYNDDKRMPLHRNLVLMPDPTNVSCTILSPSTNKVMCKALVNFYDFEFGEMVLISPQSNWTSTEGHNTTEFSQAPRMTDFNAARTCIRKISSALVTNTSQAAFLEAIQIRARAYLNSFIAEHNLAFTMTQGPATDLVSFFALVVSTVISVILGVSGPVTNFLLRKICRWRPLYLDSQCGRVRKGVRVLMLMLGNVLLSLCSFLPLVYVAWSEVKREEPFYTWDLGSEDQSIYSPIEDVHLRVVYLLSATSKYNSHFIRVSAGVVCFTCVVIVGFSVRRLREVVDRYTLLQTYDSILAGKGPEIRAGITEDKETLYARALKAIDMTDTEELSINAEVSRYESNVNDNMTQELAAQYGGRGGQAADQSEPTGRESAEFQLLPVPYRSA